MRKVLSLLLCLVFCSFVLGQTIKTSGSTTFCEGGSVELSVSGGSGNATFQWTKDGAEINAATQSTYTASSSGSYSVILSGGSPLAAVAVTVNTKPIIDFSFTNDNTCSGTLVTFTSTVTSGKAPFTYQWDFGDGNSSTAQNPTHSFKSLGCGTQDFQVKLTVKDNNGCENSVTHKVTVKQIPDVQLTDQDIFSPFSNCDKNPSPGNSSFTLTVTNSSPSAGCITSYKVDWGDGSAPQTNPSFPLSHTYTQLGAFKLVITATGANGCTNSKTYTVANQSNPAGGLGTLGSTTGLCAPANVPFIISNWENNSPGTKYILTFGDGESTTLDHPLTNNTINHTYTTTSCPGATTFTATLQAVNACDATPYTAGNIQIRIKPAASFTVQSSVCVNKSVCFSNTTVAGYSGSNCIDATQWSWDFGDGSTNASQSPCHTYKKAGIYTVTLTATNPCGTTTATHQVCVVDPPTASFSIDNAEGCIPLTVNTSNTSPTLNDCTSATYQWSVSYAATTCSAGSGFSFTGNTTASSLNPSLSFTKPGRYTITLSVTNGCGTVTTSKEVLIKAPPTVQITAIADACGPVTITPTATVSNCGTGPLTYSWVIDGGTPIATISPSTQLFSTPGVHTIALTLKNECGSASDSKTFTITPLPDVTIPANQSICPGQVVGPFSFSSSTAGTSFSWVASPQANAIAIGMPGNGTSSIPSFTAKNTTAAPISVTINVTATANGCSKQSAFTITVNPLPSAPTVTSPINYCQNAPATPLSATATSGHNLLWYTTATGGTGSATAPTPSTNTVGATTYYVSQVNNTTNCESSRSSLTVNVNAVPVITNVTGTNPTNCNSATGSLTITGLSLTKTYSISYTKNGVTTTNNYTANSAGTVTIGSLKSGTYDNITATANGCTSVPAGPVSLSDPNPPATPTTNTPAALCSGQTLSLTANSATAGVTYTWSGPNGYTSNQQNPSIANVTTASAGTYSVIAALSGCNSGAGTVNVVVNQTPVTPTATNYGPICSGNSFNLNASSSTPNVTYSWTGPNGFTSDLKSPTISGATTASGTYAVTATLGSCTSTTGSTVVQVKPTPSITATSTNPTSCSSATGLITISGLTNNTQYTYTYTKDGTTQNGTGTSTATGSLLINNLSSGIYDHIVVSQNGCPSNAVGPFTLSDPSPPATPTVKANGPICAGSTLSLEAVSATSGVTYTWTGPNNFTNTSPNPSIPNATTAASGIYSVRAKLNGCVSAVGTVSVVVNATPVVSTAGSNTPVCSGDAINLNANTTFAGAVTWEWSGPNAFTSQEQNPTINDAATASAGNYTVIATAATGACASVAKTITVVVNPTPVITDATAVNPSTCNSATGSIQLDGLTAGVTYTVTFTKNGSPATATATAGAGGRIILSALTAAVYDNISVSLSGCQSNRVGPFTLSDPNPPATPVVTSNGPVCSGGTLNLNALTTTAGAVTYTWTGPNGFASSDQKPSINNVSMAANGTYQVIATLSGCASAVGTIDVVIHETPAAPSVSSNSPVCTGTTLNLSATTSFAGPLTYAWTGPNNFTSMLSNPSISNATTAEAGAYKLVITATTGNCPSAESVTTVAVNPTPAITGSAVTNPTNCKSATGTITLNGLAATTTYTVNFTKDGTLQSATLISNASGDVTIPNLLAGVYSDVRVILTGCPSNTVGPFTLTDPNPPAAPLATTNGPVCSGTTLQLFASSTTTGVSYAWTGPNNYSSNNQNPSITTVSMAANGTYSVTATRNSCTSAVATVDVVINPTPAAPTVGSNGPLCAGSTLNLTAATSMQGTVTYAWTGPNGFTSNDQNPQVSNATSAATGTYTVIATATQGTCPSPSATIPVVIHPELVNQIETATQTICYGLPVTISGHDATGGNGTYSYEWEQSPDNTSWKPITDQTGVSITITPTSSIYLRRRVSSNPCQSFSLSAYISVQPPVSNNTLQADQSICINTPAAMLIGSLPAGADGNYLYKWEKSTDGGQTWNPVAGGFGQNYDPGMLTVTTQYRRIVTTALCSGPQSSTSNTITITVNPDASAVLLPKDTIGCPPFTITATNVNLQTYSDRNKGYEWYANNALIGSSAGFPGYTISNEDDSITIKLKAISRYGCKDDSLSQKFYTYKLPHPAFNVSDTVGCGPLTVQMQNTTPNPTLFTYFWDFGNGQTSTQANPGAITFQPNPGFGDTVYKVRLKVFSLCDTVTVGKEIRVKSKPKALFTPTKTTGCSPMSVTFKNTSKGLGNTYHWDFGDGSTLSTAGPDTVEHTFITGVVDTFYVKLRAVNMCGEDSQTYSIIVAPNSIKLNLAVNGTDRFGCEPHVASFINNSQGASVFHWNFGDGAITTTTKNLDTVRHTYLSPGTYLVTLRAINNCSDTATTERIVVYPKPRASFTAEKFTICIGDTLRLTNQSDSATAYLWTFGDGTTSTLANPVHRYKDPGSYKVALVTFRDNASGNVCTDSTVHTIQVTSTQSGYFTVSDSVGSCAPFTLTLVNRNRPSVNAVWDLGDGTTATGDSLVHTYQVAGSYGVKLTTTSPGGCTYVTTKAINVSGPKGTLQYSGGFVCHPAAVRFQAVATGTTGYAWDFGDGQTAITSQQTIFHTYAEPGYYVPKVTLQNGTCGVLLSGTDTIKVDKVDGGFTVSKTEVCGATTLTFTDTSHVFFGTQSIRWNFGDNTYGTGTSPSHTFTTSGRYTVQMIIQSKSGCTDTVVRQLDVFVKSKPVVSINAPDTACNRKESSFNAVIQTADPVGFTQWNLSNGAGGTAPVFKHTFTQPGTYDLRFIAGTVNGCFDTAYHSIQINPSPVVSASSSQTLCLGNAVQLTAVGAANWQWQPLKGLSCYNCGNPVASPTQTTPYVVEGKNSYGCTDRDTVIVTVIQPLKLTVSPNDSICIGQSSNLLVRGGTSYNWSPAQGLNSTTISNPTASPTVTTTYRVVGYDGYNCFTDTAFVTVAVGQYPTVELGPDLTLAAGTQHQLVSTVTNGPIRNWAWTPGTNLSCSHCAVPVADIKKDITYSVKVTTPYGCSASDTISIKVFCESSQVFIPNAFTPDGDGINDILMVRSKGVVTVKFFRIFNRWGTLVFEKSNFQPNNPLYGWDGKVSGVAGGPDVYVYTCEVLCENGTSFTYKGNVSIIK